MIMGIFHKQKDRIVHRDCLKKMSQDSPWDLKNSQMFFQKNVGFAYCNQYPGECLLYHDDLTSVVVVFQGAIYNMSELAKSVKCTGPRLDEAKLIACLYHQYGYHLFDNIQGKFTFALYDQNTMTLLLGRDRIGVEPLYYFEDSQKIIFASRLKPIVDHPEIEKRLSNHAITQYLLYCYNPSFDSFFLGVKKLRPGHYLLNQEGRSKIERYWKLSFKEILDPDENEIAEKLRYLINEAVERRIKADEAPGLFLSGGMDSSTIAAFTSVSTNRKINTYSYHCRSESFDESKYAQIVSNYYHTRHELIEYSSDQVVLMAQLVTQMDEPFCDVGINIATGILGKAACGKVSYVLTGDGGDELFGGHPVYLADPFGRIIDRIPAIFKNPFLWMGRQLRDSDKKKDFKVKWQRFSISVQFPQNLLSHRWRLYYHPEEITKFLSEDLLTGLDISMLYNPVLALNAEADGPDYLSRSLYSDYQTVVGFYLRRMDLVRHFGIEGRFPMLDDQLVAYCAKIPSTLKIRNGTDTKYILKETMKEILPHDIVYRNDKLGHSIPLKNWMRYDPAVRAFMLELVSRKTIKKRDLFNPNTIKELIHEHMSKKRNYSHRLWALMVLELWLRHHMDK